MWMGKSGKYTALCVEIWTKINKVGLKYCLHEH